MAFYYGQQSNLQILDILQQTLKHHKHKNFNMQNSNLQQENKLKNLFLVGVVIATLYLSFLTQSPKM